MVQSQRDYLEAVPEENNLDLQSVLCESFIKRHTEYESCEAFFDDGGEWTWWTPEGFRAIPEDELDRHVYQTSEFRTWQEMEDEAVLQWLDRHLVQ